MRTPVAFIGYSNSGKTTFLVSLVGALSRDGERVAVIKHTHHDPSRRKPRGDTELFLDAGAAQVVLAGATEAVIMGNGREPELREFASAAEIPSWLDVDRTFVEGFKTLDFWPRILVERPGAELIRPVPEIIAVITESTELFDVPRFRPDDLDGVRGFLDRISAG